MELDINLSANSELGSLLDDICESDPGMVKKSGNFYTPDNDSFYKSFVYEALSSTVHEIQLLRVLPEPLDGLVQCEMLQGLSVVDLKKQYFALSYCAGDPAATRQIFIDGVVFNVFANLGHAIDEVIKYWQNVSPNTEQLIWIDQICINQMDVDERSVQVQSMREVYSSAYEVLICLSSNQVSSNSGNGLRWLRGLSRIPTLPAFRPTQPRDALDHWSATYDHKSGTISNFRAYIKQGQELTFKDDSEAHNRPILDSFLKSALRHRGHQHWLSFIDLLESRWWRRCWVFQELMAADQACFLWHGEVMQGDELSNLVGRHFSLLEDEVEFIFQHDHEPGGSEGLASCDICTLYSRHVHPDTTAAVGAVKFMLGSKASWKGSCGLGRILLEGSRCLASDPRDKVYAFLGVASVWHNIPVDYSAGLEGLLTKTAQEIIRTEGELKIIHSAMLFVSTGLTTLPSWVPNWSSTTFLQQGELMRGAEFFLEFYRLPQTSLLDNERPFEVRGQKLEVSGYVLDYIEYSGPPANTPVPDPLKNTVSEIPSQTECEAAKLLIKDFLGPILPDRKRAMDHIRVMLDGRSPTLENQFILQVLQPFAVEGDPHDDIYPCRRILHMMSLAFRKRGPNGISLRMVRTDTDVAVVVRSDVQSGDQLWAVQSLRCPIILRPTGDAFQCISNVYGTVQSFRQDVFEFTDESVAVVRKPAPNAPLALVPRAGRFTRDIFDEGTIGPLMYDLRIGLVGSKAMQAIPKTARPMRITLV